MNNQYLIIPVVLTAIFATGVVFGINLAYQVDTYQCTIKCPNNAHSISINQVCYCEVK